MPDQRHITVALEDGERHGRYVGRVAGFDAEGEITFTRRGSDLISADHTGVTDELRGTGLAAAMVEYLVADARARGFQIIPICPYVRARYEKHPEWRDVFTVGPGEKPKLTAAQFRGE
ncbi:GNAT family N-acetyltransferase [Pelagerythrobacter marensis]|uniref:Acetyltransferase n=1 Tax=Pelagerythrobacter marensis TaxID=543877 RepID=A0A0G3X4B3_9SPHN|nr:GNAT family N-acetyltransferase [Pelagerythrobacter marensis]AKM06385.1 acetyltransferase [Pelagerythrobacter marensis]